MKTYDLSFKSKPLFGFAVILLLTFFWILPRCVGQGVLSGPIVNPNNGYTYYLLNSDTWTASEAEAVSLGGTLATVQNQSENTWILNTFGPMLGNSGANLWIGLYDPISNDGTGAQHAADFIWASGQPVTYTSWGQAEPDNGPAWGGEYYTILMVVSFSQLVPGDWNDQNNTASSSFNYGVVEVVPEPTSLGLFIFGSGILFVIGKNSKQSSIFIVKQFWR
ncbi:MAG: lectin-like protein [Verrucomicrobiota bacterium]